MNSTGAIRIGLVTLACCVPGFAQLQHNIEKQLTCQNGFRDGQRARYCELREQAVASIGRVAVASSSGCIARASAISDGA